MKSIEALDWSALTTQLDEGGFAQTPRIYTAADCKRLAASFEDDERFRSTVDMRRHRFAVIFPTRQRPVRGKRGHYRVGHAPRRCHGSLGTADHSWSHLP